MNAKSQQLISKHQTIISYSVELLVLPNLARPSGVGFEEWETRNMLAKAREYRIENDLPSTQAPTQLIIVDLLRDPDLTVNWHSVSTS
jgi:hypothetical protein